MQLHLPNYELYEEKSEAQEIRCLNENIDKYRVAVYKIFKKYTRENLILNFSTQLKNELEYKKRLC